MKSIIRRHGFPARGISKREFLTPFDDIFNEMIGDMFPRLHEEFGNDFFVAGSYPKCNVVSFEDRVEIEAAVPGLSHEDIAVEVLDRILTIKAESNQRSGIKDEQYVHREVKRSAFARSFKLGENLDASSISGAHENGILTITIAKNVPSKTLNEPRKISIANGRS